MVAKTRAALRKNSKGCVRSKVLNPKSKRCVLRKGRVGRRVLRVAGGNAMCRPDQMLNPKTNRCVLRSGAVGKKIRARRATVGGTRKGMVRKTARRAYDPVKALTRMLTF